MAGHILHLIIDKSLFQSLPPAAFTPIDRHFRLLIPPILIKEILGDLGKDKPTSMKEVVGLSCRFGVNTMVAEDYRPMLVNSLIGGEVPMDGRIVPAGLETVKAADGHVGHTIRQTAHGEALRRWGTGNFSIAEWFWAYRWQGIKQFLNFGLYQEKLKEAGAKFDLPKNLDQLKKVVDEIFDDPKLQGTLLGLIHIEFKPERHFQIMAINRWFALKKPLMKDFAPYAAYCLRANLLLAIGHMNIALFGKPGEHDLRDLEYAYYLPFCEVFASTDRFHKKLVQLLLRDDQSFVKHEFETDLRRLSEEWFALTKEQKRERHLKFGMRPPPATDSCIYSLWERHRPDPSDGLPIFDTSSEEFQNGEIAKFMRAMADKLKKAESAEEVSLEAGNFLDYSHPADKDKLAELFPDIDPAKF